MQDNELFEDLNHSKLRKYTKKWIREYPCIQRMELFEPNYNQKDEFEFVIVCTLLSEEDMYNLPKEDAFDSERILYKYYKWVGENSSWKHIEKQIPRFYQKDTDLSKRNILKEWRWVTVSPDVIDFDKLSAAWADVEGDTIVLSGSPFEPEEDKVLTIDDVLIKIIPDVELFYVTVKEVIKNEKLRDGLLSARPEHLLKAFKKKNQYFSDLEEEHLSNFSEVSKTPRDIKAPVIQKMIESLYPHVYVDSIASSRQKLFEKYAEIKKRTKQ